MKYVFIVALFFCINCTGSTGSSFPWAPPAKSVVKDAGADVSSDAEAKTKLDVWEMDQ